MKFLLLAFLGGIAFTIAALIAIILHSSIEFIRSNRWPQDGPSRVGGEPGENDNIVTFKQTYHETHP